MTLTAEQSRALVDAIAAAPSSAAPADLRLAGLASNGERDPTALVGEMLEALEHRARPAPPGVS